MTEIFKTIVQYPEKKLEDVRESLTGNKCSGRGRETAAGRGYNTERLAGAVLATDGVFLSDSHENWYDTYAPGENTSSRIECKSCVYRYPSGAYGRFRIWRHHHLAFVADSEQFRSENRLWLYFFVVYEINDGIESEVGKVVAPVGLVDEAIDNWRKRDHPTMGEQRARDISWHLLLNRLGVSEDRLRAEATVDLTPNILRS